MSADVLRALVETIVPGLDHDVTAGAPDIAAERYLEHYLGVERSARLAAALIGGSTSFASDDLEARAKVVRDLRRDSALRSLIDAANACIVAAVYGSWSGRDEHGKVTRQPLGWALTGYQGQVRPRRDGGAQDGG